MARVVKGTKVELGSLNSGHCCDISWDGKTSTYIVCKTTNGDSVNPSSKVTVCNLETGRIVTKPADLKVIQMAVTINAKPMEKRNG